MDFAPLGNDNLYRLLNGKNVGQPQDYSYVPQLIPASNLNVVFFMNAIVFLFIQDTRHIPFPIFGGWLLKFTDERTY